MDDKPKMPALEQWAMETAEQLFPSLEGYDRIKLAIALIQARAKECLHYSGKFAVGNYLEAVVRDGRKLHLPLEAAFALQFSDRHAELEHFASAWATRWLKEHEVQVIQ